MSYTVENIVEDFISEGMPVSLAPKLENLLIDMRHETDRLKKDNDYMNLRLSYIDNPE